MNTISSDSSGNFTYGSLEHLVMVLVGLNFDGCQRFVESPKGCVNFEGGVNASVDVGVESSSALANPNSTVKVRC